MTPLDKPVTTPLVHRDALGVPGTAWCDNDSLLIDHAHFSITRSQRFGLDGNDRMIVAGDSQVGVQADSLGEDISCEMAAAHTSSRNYFVKTISMDIPKIPMAQNVL
ncbi:MAG TPA: hypothetical protein VLM19_05360 [Nitrospiraceae bacterium]|nr:hypothetical protein [Nitrospiraceae bacterium]